MTILRLEVVSSETVAIIVVLLYVPDIVYIPRVRCYELANVLTAWKRGDIACGALLDALGYISHPLGIGNRTWPTAMNLQTQAVVQAISKGVE